MTAPHMMNLEEILSIASRKILAGTMTSEDRVLLYRLALTIIGESLLVDQKLVSQIDPEILMAIHQLTLLADESTTPETLMDFASSLEDPPA